MTLRHMYSIIIIFFKCYLFIITLSSYEKVLILYEKSLLEFSSNLRFETPRVRKNSFYESVCRLSVRCLWT